MFVMCVLERADARARMRTVVVGLRVQTVTGLLLA